MGFCNPSPKQFLNYSILGRNFEKKKNSTQEKKRFWRVEFAMGFAFRIWIFVGFCCSGFCYECFVDFCGFGASGGVCHGFMTVGFYVGW